MNPIYIILASLLKYILGNVLFVLSWLTPKKNNRWVFGAWGGRAYSDNSKYFFEYVAEHHPEIQCAWLCQNRELIGYVRSRGFEAYHAYGLSGILFSLRAQVGVVTNGMIDLNRFACGRTMIVQLWHGVPLKPVLYLDKKRRSAAIVWTKKILSVVFPFLRKDIFFHEAIIPASSAEVVRLFSRVFNTTNVKLTGFPRNDSLFRKDVEPAVKAIVDRIQGLKNRGHLVGIYLPTWRQTHEAAVMEILCRSAPMIESSLKQEKLVLFVKHHTFHRENDGKCTWSDCIIKLDNSDIHDDIYSVLWNFDFLITDYSSILFDFALTERPIILAAVDHNSYVRSNGEFSIDLEDLGLPVVGSWNDVIGYLGDIRKYPERFKEGLKSLNKRFNDFRDGENCQRVYRAVCDSMQRRME